MLPVRGGLCWCECVEGKVNSFCCFAPCSLTVGRLHQVQECAVHWQLSPYQKSTHAESNELWPLAAAIKSKPLWFSIEPASPHSMVDPTECTETGTPMAHWAASLPPTNRQPHKAVPHHQMWWSLFLILDWGPNSAADSLKHSFLFKAGGWESMVLEVRRRNFYFRNCVNYSPW